MPVAIIMDFDGGASEQYDAVMEDMQLGGRMPEGGLYHTAGSTGWSWRVVDVWEDEDAFHAFAESRIGPITQKHGLAPPRMQRLEVAQVRPGPAVGEPATFLQVVRLPGLDAAAFAAADQAVGALPDGLVLHVNGADEGGWFVIDSWRSREERDAFIEARVRPAMADAPLTGEPTFEDHDLHATMIRESAAA